MIYIILFIICISVCWLLVKYMQFEEMNLLKHLLEANNLFCIQYLFFSCCFLLFETFTVWKALICVLVFSIFLVLILNLKKISCKKWKNEKISRPEVVLIVITICMILPFIYITSEDISSDTDQGAYFLYTCILMEGKSKEVHSLREIGKISKEVDDGINILLEDLPIYEHENNTLYYIHALSSWCSFPALFGKMFGIWNSMRAVNYLYILIVINLFYVCKKFALHQSNIYLYIVMFALSPLMLYIGKAGLSEIVIVLLVSQGLHYIFEKGTIFSIFGGICIGLIGYVHISMLLYMPIVTGIALLESTKKKKIGYFNIIQLILFGLSMWYAYKISPIYVKKQYFQFTMHKKISYFTIFLLIDLIVLISILMQMYIMYKANNFFYNLRNIIYGNYKIMAVIIWGIILCRTIYYAYFMCFTDKFAIKSGMDAGSWNLRSNYINKGIMAVSYLNIVNIARAVGIIGVLFLVVIPFLKYNITDIAKMFYFVTLYGMVIFTVFKMDTPFNYYASRYFVPMLIPMIVLTVVSTVKSKNWCIYFMIVVMLYNHHFLPAFLMGAPKVGQYEVLQNTLKIIPKNVIVFCNPESPMINAMLSSNLRIQNDNEVYNLNNMDEVLAFNQNNKESAYIISESELEVDAKLIKSNIYISQYSFGNGLNGMYNTEVGTYQVPLYIYQVVSCN